MKTRNIIIAILATMLCTNIDAQQKLTKEEILAMSIGELSELPLEDLMEAVETLGVSSVDELFALIMNKNVSSASKTEEDSFTSPLSSTVITRDEIRTYGITTIEEALRLIPGMIVSEKTNGVYDVQMRGLNNIPDNNIILYTENANTLLMVDGRIAHNYAMGAPMMDVLPISIEDIERIEVVRGATSALYGPNAVNGVINIITNKPDQNIAKVSGCITIGNNAYTGEAALRRIWNSKIATGLTFNMQLRKRPTEQIYVMPAINSFLLANEKLIPDYTSLTVSEQQFGQMLQTGELTDLRGGAYIDPQNVRGHVTISTADDEEGNTYYILRRTHIEQTDEIYPTPDVSRKNVGVNGYLTLTPTTDTRIDISGGYQYSFVANTPLGNENFSFRNREYSTAYVNLAADIKGLHVLANYLGGVNDYCIGNRSFYMYNKMANASIEYEVNVGGLNIRPGIGYQKTHFKDHEPLALVDYGNGHEEVSGFFGYYSKGNNYCENQNISGYLKLDYHHNGLRLVGAARFDKTKYPDEWNPTWQFVTSYQFNDNNFIRLNYGRARRSAVLANTSSNYNWHHEGAPEYLQYLGNEETPLVKIDNVEIGYRWKPTDRLLVDAEAFMSWSSDYGELKSYESMLRLSGTSLNNALVGLMSGSIDAASLGASLPSMFGTKTYIRYDEVPFKVQQMGISLNLDWIISSKLIAKINANIQRTTIDNYYKYSQEEMIMRQLLHSKDVTLANIGPLITEVMTGAQTKAYIATIEGKDAQAAAMAYIEACTGYTPIHNYATMFNAMTEDEQQNYLEELKNMYEAGQMVDGNVRPLGLYYALKYNVRYDRESDSYYFGSTVAEPYTTEDNYKHKAAPAFYGNIGLIYRPTEKLSISTYAYLMGKREYTTIIGTQEVDPYCTINMKIGYKPIPQCEIFMSAHNLLNTQKREFIYTDKIEGTYSVGINFAF